MARTSGLINPIRKYVGPIAGRLVFKVSNDPDIPFMVGGHKMILAQEGQYPPLAMVQDKYEEETSRLMEQILKPGMTFIDVGAHVGFYSLKAAREVSSSGSVFSFEPEPLNYGLLTKNIELNGYSNIKVINMAVSNTIGTTNLYLAALDNGRHSLYHHQLPETGSALVETTTLDSFFKSKGWPPRIDLVKIDVEGAEITVLDGMTQLMADYSCLKLIVELNPALLVNGGATPIQLFEMLISQSWDVQVIEEDAGATPLMMGGGALPLIDRLLATGTSVNLFCTRP